MELPTYIWETGQYASGVIEVKSICLHITCYARSLKYSQLWDSVSESLRYFCPTSLVRESCIIKTFPLFDARKATTSVLNRSCKGKNP